MNTIENCFIYDFSELPQDAGSSLQITCNTVNTWQPNRGFAETAADTRLGKRAELCVEKYICENIKDVKYLPYDDFRGDNFEKHATFDALLYNVSNENISDAVQSVNKEVSLSRFGKISDALREHLRQQNIFTAEVKSTRVNQNKKANSNFSNYSDISRVRSLIGKICRDDFLTYPRFSRSGNLT